jgi:hypothetical protein
MAYSERLSGITPTLTRPHRGGGNALAIREYRTPVCGEGWVGVTAHSKTMRKKDIPELFN